MIIGYIIAYAGYSDFLKELCKKNDYLLTFFKILAKCNRFCTLFELLKLEGSLNEH